MAEKEEDEEKEKEDDEEEAVKSLPVASGPSVEVGEGGCGSITLGNGVCDCDGVRRRMKDREQDHRGRTVRMDTKVAEEGNVTI